VRYAQASVLAQLLLVAQAVTSTASAETQYVIETLVVNVNNAPDASGTRVATVKSGDAVEVLERQGDQVHVKLANGTEGWIRKSYLSEKESLQRQLDRRGVEVDTLKKQIATLQEQLAAPKNTAAEPEKPAEATPGEPEYFMTPPEAPARPVWHWALGSFVVALALGFALGWQVLDRRIRRKYGGLRIY
jgi:TolA-binding protein